MIEAVGASQAAVQRFLTFKIDDRLYALPAEEVVEVIRVPPVTCVPRSPKSLLGLANLRGAVVPVASLRGMLEQEAVESRSGRAIILGGAELVAIAVDCVQALVPVVTTQLETRQAAELSAEPGEFLRGAFLGANGAVTKILDIRALLARAFASRPRASQQLRLASRGELRHHSIASPHEQKLLSFTIADQEYAFELDAVREIIPVPHVYAVNPNSESLAIGITAYRDTLLPLLFLRGLLGFPVAERVSGAEKILVIVVGNVLVGLLVDRARSILAADPQLIEQPSAVLTARSSGETQIKAIYRGDAGRRLISILSPDRLFREDIMQRLWTGLGAGNKDAGETGAVGHRKFLVFRLGQEEFALPIEAIDEVANVPAQISRLPKAPDFLEGVVNLRGAVLPVIDQRKRFDMQGVDSRSVRRLIVVRSERHRAALIVDGVSEVLGCLEDAIEPAPQLTNEEAQIVFGVINLELAGRMILLLDPAELLSHAERGLLDSLGTEVKQDPL